MLRLPNPDREYSVLWANQYTRTLEAENQQLWNAIQLLQQFVLPNYTTAEKNALTAQKGMMVYDTTLNKACVYCGSWQTITSIP